jgi:multidrug resistance efflux pump
VEAANEELRAAIEEYRAKKAELNKDIQRRRELYVSNIIIGEIRNLMLDH